MYLSGQDPRTARLSFPRDPSFGIALDIVLDIMTNKRMGQRTKKKKLVQISAETPIDEATLRRFAANPLADSDGCAWIKKLSPKCHISITQEKNATTWRLSNGERLSAILRLVKNDRVLYYDGDERRERLVRMEDSDGATWHFAGDRNEERRARVKYANGSVVHYEGFAGSERMVMCERADGTVAHFGENEQFVRLVGMDGTVLHYQGDKGAERKVLVVKPNGMVAYFEGEREQERLYRMDKPNGAVAFYAGEQDRERVVRVEKEYPTGERVVVHYAGQRGSERVMRIERENLVVRG